MLHIKGTNLCTNNIWIDLVSIISISAHRNQKDYDGFTSFYYFSIEVSLSLSVVENWIIQPKKKKKSSVSVKELLVYLRDYSLYKVGE